MAETLISIVKNSEEQEAPSESKYAEIDTLRVECPLFEHCGGVYGCPAHGEYEKCPEYHRL